jgi:hypothetical protein
MIIISSQGGAGICGASEINAAQCRGHTFVDVEVTLLSCVKIHIVMPDSPSPVKLVCQLDVSFWAAACLDDYLSCLWILAGLRWAEEVLELHQGAYRGRDRGEGLAGVEGG